MPSSHLSPPSTRTSTLEPLSAVHPNLLDILRQTCPTLLIRISRAFYTDLVPALYGTLDLSCLSVEGVERVLYGWEGGRKRAALGLVSNLTVGPEALEAFCNVTSTYRTQDGPAVGPSTHFPPTSPLFPNLTNLHLPWSLVSSLAAQFDESSNTPSGIGRYALALRDLVRPQVVHLELRAEEPSTYWSLDNAILALLGPLLECSGSDGARNAGTGDRLGGDRGEQGENEGPAPGGQHNEHTRTSTPLPLPFPPAIGTATRARVVVWTRLPPRWPERGYIPHHIPANTSVHFINTARAHGAVHCQGPDIGAAQVQVGSIDLPQSEGVVAIEHAAPAAAAGGAVRAQAEHEEGSPSVAQYAKVIRDHYDVHISQIPLPQPQPQLQTGGPPSNTQNAWQVALDPIPSVRYCVDDAAGIRAELAEMRERRVRVDDAILDESRGVLVQL